MILFKGTSTRQRRGASYYKILGEQIAMILKKRFVMIGCCIGFVFLLVLTYSLYTEKRMYEQYLTMNVRQDMVDTKSAIINNDILFDRILKNEKITNEMVEDGEQASGSITTLQI